MTSPLSREQESFNLGYKLSKALTKDGQKGKLDWQNQKITLIAANGPLAHLRNFIERYNQKERPPYLLTLTQKKGMAPEIVLKLKQQAIEPPLKIESKMSVNFIEFLLERREFQQLKALQFGTQELGQISSFYYAIYHNMPLSSIKELIAHQILPSDREKERIPIYAFLFQRMAARQEKLQAIVEDLIPFESLCATTAEGKTALHLAVEILPLDPFFNATIKWLLEKGASPLALDQDGLTPSQSLSKRLSLEDREDKQEIISAFNHVLQQFPLNEDMEVSFFNSFDQVVDTYLSAFNKLYNISSEKNTLATLEKAWQDLDAFLLEHLTLKKVDDYFKKVILIGQLQHFLLQKIALLKDDEALFFDLKLWLSQRQTSKEFKELGDSFQLIKEDVLFKNLVKSYIASFRSFSDLKLQAFEDLQSLKQAWSQLSQFFSQILSLPYYQSYADNQKSCLKRQMKLLEETYLKFQLFKGSPFLNAIKQYMDALLAEGGVPEQHPDRKFLKKL